VQSAAWPHSGANSPHISGPDTRSAAQESRNFRISQQMIEDENQQRGADLARIGWLVTVLACLVTVLILVLQGYLGYAGVTLAVAISAAINLR
jgi:hypothetical protein